jgi:hypothetical protein
MPEYVLHLTWSHSLEVGGLYNKYRGNPRRLLVVLNGPSAVEMVEGSTAFIQPFTTPLYLLDECEFRTLLDDSSGLLVSQNGSKN